MTEARTVRMDLMRGLCVRRTSAVTMNVSTSVTMLLMDHDASVLQVSILVRT